METLVLVLTPVSVAAFVLVLARLLFSRLAARAQDSKEQQQQCARAPGPPALPVLGNVHQLPRAYQERTFAAWAKTYGASPPWASVLARVRRRGSRRRREC